MATTSNDTPTRTVDVAGTPFTYREVGAADAMPLVLLHHFTAVLDEWDPALLDGLAAERRVIVVDNRGVGGSGGETPDSVDAMAADIVGFLGALGLSQVDMLGFSLGGMVAQVIAQTRPDVLRRIILAGTSPAGDKGPAGTGHLLQAALQKAEEQGKHPKHFLFFTPSPAGQAAADALLARLGERKDRDEPVSDRTIAAQLTALAKWERETSPTGLTAVRQPALVVNGDDDVMLPTRNSFHLAELLPDARLSIYPDAGHGSIFQFHDLFVQQALDFLRR